MEAGGKGGGFQGYEEIASVSCWTAAQLESDGKAKAGLLGKRPDAFGVGPVMAAFRV
jgi:hypothetical protein